MSDNERPESKTITTSKTFTTTVLGKLSVVRAESTPPELWQRHETSAQTASWADYGHAARQIAQSVAVCQLFENVSRQAGGWVQVGPAHRGMPCLIDRNHRAVHLWEFVEALDEVVDYDEVQAELPGLSYAQIDGAIGFLRKLMQFNIDSVDPDALQDLEAGRDQKFIEELRRSLADQEPARVLYSDQSNR